MRARIIEGNNEWKVTAWTMLIAGGLLWFALSSPIVGVACAVGAVVVALGLGLERWRLVFALTEVVALAILWALG